VQSNKGTSGEKGSKTIQTGAREVPEILVLTVFLQLSMLEHHTLGVLSSEPQQWEDSRCMLHHRATLRVLCISSVLSVVCSNLLFLVANSLEVSGRRCTWIWLTDFDLKITFFYNIDSLINSFFF
jgi:hypothetical protein